MVLRRDFRRFECLVWQKGQTHTHTPYTVTMCWVFGLPTKTIFPVFLEHFIPPCSWWGPPFAAEFPYCNSVYGCKCRRRENTLTDSGAVSSRELIVEADSGQTPGRCSWQPRLFPQTCGLLSWCNEIIFYTSSSPEPCVLLAFRLQEQICDWNINGMKPRPAGKVRATVLMKGCFL